MSILAIGTRVGDRYVVEAEIGRGGMQEVYKAYDETLNRVVALKVPQDASVARKFRQSAVLSAKVNHPNVAKTLDYLEDTNGMFFMVEELIDGANLRDLANNFDRLDPHATLHVLHHLARGLAASHRVDVVHRDLKPSNIMIGGGLRFSTIKITDFGIAKMAEHEVNQAVAGGEDATRASKTVMNALAYVAPEVIDEPKKASKPADVWAIAAIAWELLTGEPPFGVGLQAIKRLANGAISQLPNAVAMHPQFGGLAQQIHALILSCLQHDPAARPAADALATACEQFCYLPPAREEGMIKNYVGMGNTFGFISADSGETVFFHTRNLIGTRPVIGTRVWYSKFEGEPHPRAIPVMPFKPRS